MTPPERTTHVRLLGLLGMAFAGLGLAADLLLQFTPDSARLGPPPQIDALLAVPAPLVAAGHAGTRLPRN